MYFGFESMSEFSFLTIGFIVVSVGSMGYVVAFILGATRSGRAALKFTHLWTGVFLVALLVTVVFAIIDQQWALFFKVYGIGPMLEMGVLAFGWGIIMWFMALQYSIGRITLDEKFGGSKMRRRAAIEQAKQAQQEAYKVAQTGSDDIAPATSSSDDGACCQMPSQPKE